MSLGTAPRPDPDPSDGPPLTDSEWGVLASLQAQLDLGSPGRRAPEVWLVSFTRRLAALLWWWLDPRAEGLPMPPLRAPRRRGPIRTGDRPAGA